MTREGFSYSLDPGQMPEGWIDQFLFSKKRGFCEHYAGTVAYMLRQADIPSRVVVGFQGANVSGDGANVRWMVPYSYAHAWVEYWDARAKQWVRLDPTEWVSTNRLQSIRNQQSSSWWSQMDWLATRFETEWKMWVTYYDADQQKALWRKIGALEWKQYAHVGVWLVVLLLLWISKAWQAFSPVLSHQWSLVHHRYRKPSNVALSELDSGTHPAFTRWRLQYERTRYGHGSRMHTWILWCALAWRWWFPQHLNFLPKKNAES